MSKAKIGLSQFQYATVEDDKTNSEIFKIPGMRSAKLDITNELETVYADDGPYLVIPAGITELKLELGLVDLPTIDKQQMLGVTVESGIERYTKTIKVPDVAVMFRALMDDNKYCYVGLAKGKFNLPGMDLKTKEDKIEVAEDSITGNFVARGEEEDMLFIGREDNKDFKLDAFTKMVFNGETVPKSVTGVTVNHKTATIKVGETTQLTETVTPADAADKSVTWSSSNETVASVNASGLVTAKATGNAKVTVKTTDGNFTADSDITVTDNN